MTIQSDSLDMKIWNFTFLKLVTEHPSMLCCSCFLPITCMSGGDSGPECLILILFSFPYTVVIILIYTMVVSFFSAELNFPRCKMSPEKGNSHSILTFIWTKDNLTAILSLKLSLNATQIKVLKRDNKHRKKILCTPLQ